MSKVENPGAILEGLSAAGVEFVVVGGVAAVMQGAPVTTFDLDVVHRRSRDNVARLLKWLGDHNAYHRFDLANRRLRPTEEQLLGTWHVNLQTELGKLDLLCELGSGEGYEQIVADSIWMSQAGHQVRVIGLERLIQIKTAAGRPKDRVVIPVLVAALEEQRRRRIP